MRRRYLNLLFFGVIIVGFGLASKTQAASGTSCDNFNGILGVDTTCTLWAQAHDPELDNIYYVFTWGDGSTTRMPETGTVATDTELAADHTYTTSVGSPFTAFVVAYDEANHQSVNSASVTVFISSQVLSASLTGTPTNSGWYNYTTFDYTTSCTAGGTSTLNYCRTEVSTDGGASWSAINNQGAGQTNITYSGSYTYPTDGEGYRFRSTADDTNSTPVVFSTPIPASGEIQIDQSPPVALASSPIANQSGEFIVSATLLDLPVPASGVSTWDLQYSTNGGSSWLNCRSIDSGSAINAAQSSLSFGSGCSPAVNLVANTTYCFQARGRDSTSPTQNQGNYYFDAASMCTPYRVSVAPIAPHTPSPIDNALTSSASTDLLWYGGDADPLDQLTYSVYVSQANVPLNMGTDLNGTLANQLSCSADLPQGCLIASYGPPRNRTLAAGQTYQWRVRVTDGFSIVDSPIWTWVVNSPPIVTNAEINPATVNTTGTVTWQVTDANNSQSLSLSIYYGPTAGTVTGATPVVSGLSTSICTGGPNNSGWNCTYSWDTSCRPETSGQYITVTASDGIDSGLDSGSSTFTINHTTTKYYPGPGDINYAIANDTDIVNFSIDPGSIESNSANVRFRGACETTDSPTVDANAVGNPATYNGSLGEGNVSPNIPLQDLIPGQSNTLSFSVGGCGSTYYRISYNLEAACNQPYVSVEQGSIYSQGNIKAHYSPPAGKFNATYLILGGGTNTQSRIIENFITAPPPSGLISVNPNFGQLVYPSITSSSQPKISSFDYYGLTNTANGTAITNSGTNSYGHSVNVYTNLSDDVYLQNIVGSTPQSLAGKVLWVKDNLVVDQVTEFANGSSDTSGAGLIIVEGNLIINYNLTYALANSLPARSLASVGWLVRGNVIIAPSVSNVVGAFFVAGSNTGGAFSTGSSTQALTIYGAVIAKQLELQRTASSGNEPSEKVIADGRVLLNTPPGFTNIMSTLPTWQFKAP